MAVTLDDIATRLGVATPTNDSPEGKQWLAWIGDATLLVRLRAESLGLTLEGLDPEALDRELERTGGIAVSALKNRGLAELKEALADAVSGVQRAELARQEEARALAA